MSYFLVTDSACDLPEDLLNQHHVGRCPLSTNFQDGKVLEDSFREMSAREFYDGMRSGTVSTTSQVNSAAFYDMFRQGLQEHDQVICVTMASALSGTFQSAVLARITLEEDHPEYTGRVALIDSRSVSLGLGLLVLDACRRRDEGMAAEDLIKYLEERRDHIHHFFTVEDLVYLKRGGRISSLKAAFGTLLNIKPILHVNAEGKLVPLDKAKGRKNSINALADLFDRKYDPAMGRDFAISHGDCEEEARQLADTLRERHGLNAPTIAPVGMVVGSHAGPGTLALFFPGKSRGETNADL